MSLKKYKNIQLTKEINKANCVTHSGKFHVDDVISTIFLSKLKKDIILIRVPTVKNINVKNKKVENIIRSKNQNCKILNYEQKKIN